MLICSALNAVRSRRPPRPQGSSGPGHSGPSSGTGCPAPDGLPPAPGDRDEEERVSHTRYCLGSRPPPPSPSTPAQRCLARASQPRRPRREPPAVPRYLRQERPPCAPCSGRRARPAGPRAAPGSARSARRWSRSRVGGPRTMLGAGSPRWGS